MPQGQPAQSGFLKPFLSEADESPYGSGNKLAASRKTCLVIEKDSCKIYAKGKQASQPANVSFTVWTEPTHQEMYESTY